MRFILLTKEKKLKTQVYILVRDNSNPDNVYPIYPSLGVILHFGDNENAVADGNNTISEKRVHRAIKNYSRKKVIN